MQNIEGDNQVALTGRISLVVLANPGLRPIVSHEFVSSNSSNNTSNNLRCVYGRTHL